MPTPGLHPVREVRRWDMWFGRGIGTRHRDQQQVGTEHRQTSASQNHRNSSRLGQVQKALMCRETTPFLGSFPARPFVDKPLAHQLGVQTPPRHPLAKLLWAFWFLNTPCLQQNVYLPIFPLKFPARFPGNGDMLLGHPRRERGLLQLPGRDAARHGAGRAGCNHISHPFCRLGLVHLWYALEAA